MWVLLELPEEPIMQAVTTIGLDIAKSVFQVHGIDAEGKVLIRCQLKQTSVINAIRAHLAEFPLCQDPRHPASALAYGNDATDAEAVCAPEHPA